MSSETNKLSDLLATVNAERAQKRALQDLVVLWLAFAFVLACLGFWWGMVYGVGSSITEVLLGDTGAWFSWVMPFGFVVFLGAFLVRKTMSLRGPKAPRD